MPIPRGCLPKSEFSRDFQSADHTALFGPPEPETQFETPNPFLSVALPSNIQFLFTPEGVGEVVKLHLPFPTLDNGTLVDQQLTFLVVHPDYGKVLEFSPPPAYSGMTPKGTANVFADSDGFLGIVEALCVKPFLCARLVSDVQMQLPCCLPPI
ncbi:hypothetical protein AVEN_10232-1 [Araneus ventricosus]|uniref:Uncharacterized protein n=1 Tax=Araneus ventricosus TaxID=182803 RepID=A0A4Y2J8B7_ARAVE|nr:hypothetical protein AVEN_10232-1 [Araneus ventricosus]